MKKKGKQGLKVCYSLQRMILAMRKKEKGCHALTCAWPPGSRGFGVPGQCLKIMQGARLNVDFGSVGLGYSFYVRNKLLGAADAAAAPLHPHPLSRGPEECQSKEGGSTPTPTLSLLTLKNTVVSGSIGRVTPVLIKEHGFQGLWPIAYKMPI